MPLRVLRCAFAGLLVVALSAGGAVAPGRTLADDASQIPGVPLVANFARDSVGGAVVDRVYAITVTTGTVLVATVTGAPGAELGLYLFLPGSTSILTDEPLTSAALPGARQSLSASLREAGTYYLDVNGRNADAAYAFTLTVTMAVDVTPPQYVRISPPARARSAHVCFTVVAVDPLSGVSDIAIGADTDPDPAWQPYVAARPTCVATARGDGSRTFTAVLRNGVGLQTRPISVTTVIDDTAPSLVRTTPRDAGSITTPRGAITWRFSEPVRTVLPLSDAIWVVNQSGVRLRGTSIFSADRTSLTFTPASAIPVGGLVQASLGEVVDVAGNVNDTIPSLSLFRRNATTLSATTVAKSATTLRVRIVASANLRNRSVAIERQVAGLWTNLKSLKLTSTVLSVNVPRAGATAVRFVWAGSDTLAPTKSKGLTLK